MSTLIGLFSFAGPALSVPRARSCLATGHFVRIILIDATRGTPPPLLNLLTCSGTALLARPVSYALLTQLFVTMKAALVLKSSRHERDSQR